MIENPLKSEEIIKIASTSYCEWKNKERFTEFCKALKENQAIELLFF